MTPSKYQRTIDEMGAKIQKILEKDDAPNSELEALLRRLDRAVFGYDDLPGIVARLTKVEDWMKSINNAGKIIAGVLTAALTIQIINLLVTHWK